MVSGQNSPSGCSQKSLNEIMLLIRVQAQVRGFLERRRYRIQKAYNENSSRYFKAEEAQETLTDQFFRPDIELEERQYHYKSGAVYSGQWKGGMRHGHGKMVWQDGGSYEGCWQYNQACG